MSDKIMIMIMDLKQVLANISGYHPDSYSTQILISTGMKAVDGLADVIEEKESKIEELESFTELQTRNNQNFTDAIIQQSDKIEDLQKENKQLESEIKDYRERLGLRV